VRPRGSGRPAGGGAGGSTWDSGGGGVSVGAGVGVSVGVGVCVDVGVRVGVFVGVCVLVLVGVDVASAPPTMPQPVIEEAASTASTAKGAARRRKRGTKISLARPRGQVQSMRTGIAAVLRRWRACAY
jgi:hypothetical protein